MKDYGREDVEHVYSQEEIDKILNRFKDDDAFTCSFLTSCYTVMRKVEVFALTWNDIDFESKTIKIKHNVYSKNKDNKGKWFLWDAKTETGERQVYICDTLLKILNVYKEKQYVNKKKYGNKYYSYYLEEVRNKHGKVTEYRIIENEKSRKFKNKINLVLVNRMAKYSGTESIRYPFKIIHNKLWLENCRFYDLRGTYATKILQNGAEIRDVAYLLGHRKIETTEDYYISSTEETRKNANELLENTIQSDVINKSYYSDQKL